MNRGVAYLLAIVVIAILAAAPLWAAEFTITLAQLYRHLCAGRARRCAADRRRRADVVRPGRVCRHRRLRHRLADDGARRFAVARAFVRARLDRAVAALLGAVTLRLGGHFLPLGTIAWGLSIYFLFGNIDALGGHNGLTDVPPISIGSISLEPNAAIYYLIWIMLAAAMLVVANLLESREGRAIRSLRGGAVMVESLGINVFRIRLITFVIAALLAGLSGWLYAHMSRFVSPAPFDVRMGIEYLFMAILGGSGQILGAVVGSALLTHADECAAGHPAALLPQRRTTASDRVRRHLRAGTAIRPRRRDAVRAALSAASAKTADRRTPSRCRGAAMPEPGTPLLGGRRVWSNASAASRPSARSVFEVAAGEIVGLIGPNGAGKSTLFNLITGAMPSDGGTVSFLGQDITRANQRRIAEAGIARTFQHVKLRSSMSLIDNVLLGTYLRTRAGFLAARCGSIAPKRRARASRRCAQLERVGLGAEPHDLAGNLPLGRQRILEVARALAADPALIILDEPAAGLSRPGKRALAELLRALRKEGVTVLLVEHDVEFVMGLVDRIVVMDFGSKLVEGTPASVRADPRVQEAYLGSVA